MVKWNAESVGNRPMAIYVQTNGFHWSQMQTCASMWKPSKAMIHKDHSFGNKDLQGWNQPLGGIHNFRPSNGIWHGPRTCTWLLRSIFQFSSFWARFPCRDRRQLLMRKTEGCVRHEPLVTMDSYQFSTMSQHSHPSLSIVYLTIVSNHRDYPQFWQFLSKELHTLYSARCTPYFTINHKWPF